MKNLRLSTTTARPLPRGTRFRPYGVPPPRQENDDAEKRPPRRHLTVVFRAR